MKRLISTTFVLLGALAGTASAQTQATAPVKATVQQDLQLTSEGETDFGTIGNNAHTEVIDPKAPKPTQTTARFTSTSSGNTLVLYSCPSEVTLTGPGSAWMTFTTGLSANIFSDVQSDSHDQTCTEATFGSHSSPVYFWLGGSLEVLSNQAPGSYNGVFTLTAAYQ